MRNSGIPALLIIWLIPTYGGAQDCVDTIVATFDSTQYETTKDGTVTDKKNQLLWTQCSLGQRWQNGHCTGNPQNLTWNDAIQAAKKWKYAGYSDWRLPNIYELSAITELSCQQPAINLKFFPDTPAVDFWTATEFINNTDQSWRVHFGFGENHTARKSNTAAVRLVRSIRH